MALTILEKGDYLYVTTLNDYVQAFKLCTMNIC
jgi:hypothetical protein